MCETHGFKGRAGLSALSDPAPSFYNRSFICPLSYPEVKFVSTLPKKEKNQCIVFTILQRKIQGNNIHKIIHISKCKCLDITTLCSYASVLRECKHHKCRLREEGNVLVRQTPPSSLVFWEVNFQSDRQHLIKL